ncbi:MAG: LAO/AO transport system kinase [Candidatus Endobugula sp.]|jgi:LAO/AO transport system kinase
MAKLRRLSIKEYTEGILNSDRVILSRAITLVESNLLTDITLAQALLENIIPHAGKSVRIGITGVPGVGKSTFIESFGEYITNQDNKLAVLTVDPSSQLGKGSILGDKTRMESLSRNPKAFIRPSASGSTLGGVSGKTREVMLLCEAAGYNVIFVETVGVGQSETLVHGMVDFFLLLMLAGAGDELQGIKKGIMEMADAVVINKADGDNIKPAQRAKIEYQNALHLFPASESGWIPEVKTCSAIKGEGLSAIWQMMEKYLQQVQTNNFFEDNRKTQNLKWMKANIHSLLEQEFYGHQAVMNILPEIEKAVQSGELPALNAARLLLQKFKGQ